MRFQASVSSIKKSGKSTLLNCLLGEHLSPTGSELATPNSIAYRGGNKHRLTAGNRIVEKLNGQELKRLLEKEFSNAQYDVDHQFCLANMEVEHASTKELLPSWTLIDTPGPDAA